MLPDIFRMIYYQFAMFVYHLMEAAVYYVAAFIWWLLFLALTALNYAVSVTGSCLRVVYLLVKRQVLRTRERLRNVVKIALDILRIHVLH